MVERLHFEGLVAVGDLHALAAARGDRDHLVGGKAPLVEDVQHGAAHVARGADDRDLVAHRLFSGGFRLPGVLVRPRGANGASKAECLKIQRRTGPAEAVEAPLQNVGPRRAMAL